MGAMSTRRLSMQRFLPVVATVLAAFLVAQSIARDPRYFGPFFAVGALMAAPALLSRWRMRRLLMSGDVERLLGMWRGSIDRVPHRETMVPLLQATAYAAYGWLHAGRRALQRALPGPAWDAALEQRLFVETLLDTFEGERDAAVRKAELLETMPMPVSGLFARRRIVVLRKGLTALVRAFSHSSREGDAKALSRAADASPLVHWAMRYAAAIVAIDCGRASAVRALLASAPSWPQESVFRGYHDELIDRANHEVVAVPH
jgi:hypothetical protein